jgi:hypothetical protein
MQLYLTKILNKFDTHHPYSKFPIRGAEFYEVMMLDCKFGVQLAYKERQLVHIY